MKRCLFTIIITACLVCSAFVGASAIKDRYVKVNYDEAELGFSLGDYAVVVRDSLFGIMNERKDSLVLECSCTQLVPVSRMQLEDFEMLKFRGKKDGYDGVIGVIMETGGVMGIWKPIL